EFFVHRWILVLDPAVVTAKRGYGRDFFGAELNVYSIQVGLLSLRLGGARNWNNATRVVPGKRDLASAYAVALTDFSQQWLFDEAAAVAQRAPRLGDNTAGIMPLHLLNLWEVRVELNLVYRWELTGFLLQALDVLRQEVG